MAKQMLRRARVAGGGLLLGLGALSLAVAAPGALAADQDVAMSGFAFSPATVTVTEGDTVTWSNSDAVAHTATAEDGSFDTGSIGGGSSDSVTFDAAGTFAYHCTIHPSMTGTVVVEAAAAASPSPAASAAASASPAASSAPSASSAPTTPPTDTVLAAPAAGTQAGSAGLPAGLAMGLALLAAAAGAGALLSLRLGAVEVEDDDRG